MKVNTYLNFGGNCAEALRFYQQHLGAKTLMSMTYAQMPEPKNIPPGCENNILHASFVIGETRLMASDSPPDHFHPMNGAYLCLAVDSSKEAERIYSALSEGGEVQMPLGETFYALSFAMLRDKFGVLWMIIHERPMPAGA